MQDAAEPGDAARFEALHAVSAGRLSGRDRGPEPRRILLSTTAAVTKRQPRTGPIERCGERGHLGRRGEPLEHRRVEPIDRDQPHARAARHDGQWRRRRPAIDWCSDTAGVEEDHCGGKRRQPRTQQPPPGCARDSGRPHRRAGAGHDQRQRGQRDGMSEQQANHDRDRETD